MQNELLNNQGKPFFRWEYDAQNNWLYTNWIGYISKTNGLKAAKQLLKLLEEKHYQFVLNDNRELCGPWGGGDEGNKWFQEIFFPKAKIAGLRFVAHILAPGIASALMAQDLHQRLNGSVNMQLFGEVDKAKNWLREMQKVKQE